MVTTPTPMRATRQRSAASSPRCPPLRRSTPPVQSVPRTRHRCRVDDDAALAAGGWLILRHGHAGEPDDVEGPDEIDADDPLEMRKWLNAILGSTRSAAGIRGVDRRAVRRTRWRTRSRAQSAHRDVPLDETDGASWNAPFARPASCSHQGPCAAALGHDDVDRRASLCRRAAGNQNVRPLSCI